LAAVAHTAPILVSRPLAPAASVLSTVAVAIVYFITARLSLVLLEPVDGVAVFWPAAGVASGILIAFGSAARWPVVIGVGIATVAANLLGDRNIWSSVFFAAANAGEALIVAGLIQRFFGWPFELHELPSACSGTCGYRVRRCIRPRRAENGVADACAKRCTSPQRACDRG
jgi:hypothetical protein